MTQKAFVKAPKGNGLFKGKILTVCKSFKEFLTKLQPVWMLVNIANVPCNSTRTATRYAVFCHKNFQLQGGDAKIHMTGAESGMGDNIGQASITRSQGVAS